MKDTVVTPENVPQIVQAMYENVKSNQHRIDEMRPVLQTMSTRVEKLNTLLVENGYALAVKTSAAAVKDLQHNFNNYLLDRAVSCPTLKKLEQEKTENAKQKQWHITLFKILVAGIGAVSTLIVIYEKVLM